MKSIERYLLTRADDFGASAGANHAILEAARGGFIRNVGLMAPGPALEEGVKALLDLPASLRPCLGLHATINSEWETHRWGPLLPEGKTGGLTRADGTFHPFPKLTAETASPRTILEEVEAQLRHLRSLGVPVEYMDTHMGFAWIPGVCEGLVSLAREEGLVWNDADLFPSLKLSSREDPAPGPGDVLALMQSRSIDHAVWVFHPNARDPLSESLHVVGQEPSDIVARERDQEYRVLTHPAWVKSFLHHPHLRVSTYPQAAQRKGSGRGFWYGDR